ncbi:MAG: hypothetical protein Q7S74_00560 [Nanoarchaeota archaeon]|nr:hypothetical protein [Nanoarchaeota archaeon]
MLAGIIIILVLRFVPNFSIDTNNKSLLYVLISGILGTLIGWGYDKMKRKSEQNAQ